jgi:hypothetical protein
VPPAGSDQDGRRCVRFGCLEVADWMVRNLQGGELPACEVDLDVISTTQRCWTASGWRGYLAVTMSVLASRLDQASASYRANRSANLRLLEEIAEQLAKARAGGGPKYVERHRARGKLLARERIELLVDRDAPFLELSPLAAWGSDFPVGASSVTGIGPIEGVECVITASDPTVRGGATNPFGLKKTLRAMEIAERNRLKFSFPAAPYSGTSRACHAPASPRSRWCSAARPQAAPTCRVCRTTPSWSPGAPRCSWAGRRW